MNNSSTEPVPRQDAVKPGRVGQSVRTMVLLVVAASALLAFIAFLGDFRRRQNTLAQMQWHAATYKSRMGNTDQLPLNLEPDVARERQAMMIKIKWIDRNAARVLRRHDGPVIATYSTRIPQRLGSDGRAVLFFENGDFRVEWMDLTAFDAALEEQRERVATLATHS